MSTERFRMGRALPRLAFTFAALSLFGTALPAQQELPSPRSIIDRHIEATGGRKAVLAHTSMHMVGTVTVPSNGMTGSFEAFGAKPNKVFVRNNVAGIGESLEGFDGRVAWTTSPLTGPMLLQGKELEQRRFDADFYSELHPSERYASMKTLEKTMWEGRPAYKVSLVRKDGSEDIEYYDVETGFKTGRVVTREMMMMGAVPVTHIAMDYRRFGNLMHAVTTKQKVMGAQIVVTIASVEYDKVDPAVFELPAAVKALIKQ